MAISKRYLILFFLSLVCLISSGCSHEPKLRPSSPQPASIIPSKAKLVYNLLLFWKLEASKDFNATQHVASQLLQHAAVPVIYLEVANFYWQHLHFDKARQILKQGIGKWPRAKSLYLSLVKTYLAQNQLQSAATTLEEYLKNNPHDYSIYPDLAAIYLASKRYAQSIDLLKNLPPDKQTKQSLYYLGRANLELGQIKAAKKYLKLALKKDPLFFKAWLELAYLYEKQKEYVKAIQVYQRLLAQNPKDQDLILRLISLHIKLNQPQQALNLLKKYQPTLSQESQLNVVLELLDNDYSQEAKKLLRDVIQKYGYSDKIYFFLALVSYHADKDPKQTLKWLEQLSPKSDYYANALSLRARILLEQKQYDQAQKLLTNALKLFPQNKELALLSIYLLESKQNYTLALAKINHYLKIWPRDKKLLYHKALILEHLQQRDKAIKLVEKMVELYPDYAPALNFLGYVLAEQGRDLTRAKVLITQALKAEPDNGYYLDSLAWIYYKLNDYQKAWEIIQKAVKYVSDDPTIWEHYGDIALKQGLLKQAKQAYLRALKIKPSQQLRQKLSSLAK